ncbi:helix-turn-helix domain-containing protein [Kiritimatiella glycovorans]|uniref:HTH cro/C1-type domain-containing protein n=1 Tax=Kiritimatiella glycovorans TaxID=1307763 RepID=A0A0G3EFJ8_9BACT|nr:helix-turn-helix transcriptional regulator [Kiritimatiella glycovorans]AKJ65241.1 hypothetical protein L21SP4_02007 [Kiritimatiella glycovorans]
MSTKYQSASEAAAFLADDPEAKERIDLETARRTLVTALVRERVRKGLSQKDIAQAMRCDSSKISRIEAGNDLSLKWGDIIGYLAAMKMNVSLVMDDATLPAAARIKQCVFRTHELLEDLVQLAREVDGDTEITDKIHQFYGEVLFNFAIKFGSSYEQLKSVLAIPESETLQALFADDQESRQRNKRAKAAGEKNLKACS